MNSAGLHADLRVPLFEIFCWVPDTPKKPKKKPKKPAQKAPGQKKSPAKKRRGGN